MNMAILLSLLLISTIVIAMMVVRKSNAIKVQSEELQSVESKDAPTTIDETKRLVGEVSEELSLFIFENDQTLFELELTFDPYDSLELLEWINDGEGEAIHWFRIEHGQGGTELGFYHNDSGIHINSGNKRAVKLSGTFQVESEQGPKDGWMTVTVRTVA